MEQTAGADRGVHWVDKPRLGSLVGLSRFIVDAASVLVNIIRKEKNRWRRDYFALDLFKSN